MLVQPAFHLTACLFFLVLLSWPLVSIPNQSPNGMLTLYLFVVWGALILLLALVAHCLAAQERAGTGEDEETRE